MAYQKSSAEAIESLEATEKVLASNGVTWLSLSILEIPELPEVPRDRNSDPVWFGMRQRRSVASAPITGSEYRSRGTRPLSSQRISRIDSDTRIVWFWMVRPVAADPRHGLNWVDSIRPDLRTWPHWVDSPSREPSTMPGLALSSALKPFAWVGFWLTISSTTFGQAPATGSTPASESDPSQPAAGHSTHGEAFDEGPRRRAVLLPGMGVASFPVVGVSPEVQAFLNQGVAQLHSFYYFEAERSFRQAAALDPGCPMADWGMAMANVDNAKRAKGFLKSAHAKAKGRQPSPREQLYLDSLDALYKEGASNKDSKKAYLLALETIVQEHPDDNEARAWMAMVTWQNAGSDGIGSRQAVDMVLDSVIAREPMHPGAEHYRIHLWDHVKPNRALSAANLYASTAPGIAHAWHMPGHTFTELKQYARAAYQQEGSARVDHAAMARDKIMPHEIHNYAHNNQWLATSLSNVGRARDAITVARNLVREPRDPQKNSVTDGGSAGRSGRLRWAEVLTRFELWDDLIAATTSGQLDWSDQPAEKVEHAYTLGLAYAATKNADGLSKQIDILQGLGKAKSGDDKNKEKDKDKDKAANGLTDAPLAELVGYQQLVAGDVTAALASFAKATRMRPEALARVHLAQRNFGLAESAAKAAVNKQPGQVAPLAAQVEVLAAAGKVEAAKAAYRDLRALAVGADSDLPVMVRLAPLVAAWNDPTLTGPSPAGPTAGLTPLEPLGPLTWSPYRAESLAISDTEGKPWSLADHAGRSVVVLFYLGGKCPHCMQQLQEFGKQFAAFGELGADMVAVGTDDLALTRELKHNNQGVTFPMPLLPDPDFAAFKAYGVFDDFEGMPLHGTFLIDGQGNIRFQKISAEPFLDVDFLKGEVARVNRLTRPDAPAQTARVGDRTSGE